MRFTTVSLFVSLVFFSMLTSCTLLVNDNLPSVGTPEQQAFKKTFMATYDIMAGDTMESGRALTPFNTAASTDSRAAVPMAEHLRQWIADKRAAARRQPRRYPTLDDAYRR